jgi:hypothetical protein
MPFPALRSRTSARGQYVSSEPQSGLPLRTLNEKPVTRRTTQSIGHDQQTPSPPVASAARCAMRSAANSRTRTSAIAACIGRFSAIIRGSGERQEGGIQNGRKASPASFGPQRLPSGGSAATAARRSPSPTTIRSGLRSRSAPLTTRAAVTPKTVRHRKAGCQLSPCCTIFRAPNGRRPP